MIFSKTDFAANLYFSRRIFWYVSLSDQDQFCLLIFAISVIFKAVVRARGNFEAYKCFALKKSLLFRSLRHIIFNTFSLLLLIVAHSNLFKISNMVGKGLSFWLILVVTFQFFTKVFQRCLSVSHLLICNYSKYLIWWLSERTEKKSFSLSTFWPRNDFTIWDKSLSCLIFSSDNMKILMQEKNIYRVNLCRCQPGLTAMRPNWSPRKFHEKFDSPAFVCPRGSFLYWNGVVFRGNVIKTTMTWETFKL